MRVMNWLFGRTLKDDRGGEVVEYAVIAGLIVVAAIAVVSAVGPKVAARWTSLDSAFSPAPASSNNGSRTTPPPVSPAQ